MEANAELTLWLLIFLKFVCQGMIFSREKIRKMQIVLTGKQISKEMVSWFRWLAWDLRVRSLSSVATELTQCGVDSACYPSEVGEMSTIVLV